MNSPKSNTWTMLGWSHLHSLFTARSSLLISPCVKPSKIRRIFRANTWIYESVKGTDGVQMRERSNPSRFGVRQLIVSTLWRRWVTLCTSPYPPAPSFDSYFKSVSFSRRVGCVSLILSNLWRGYLSAMIARRLCNVAFVSPHL